MEYGLKINPKDADKIVGKLRLAPGEYAVFAGKCANWTPVSAEWLIVTNSRLVASPTLGVKAAWEAAHGDVSNIVGDAAAKTVTVTRASGETFAFKKVAPEDHAAIIGFVAGDRDMTPPPAPVVAEVVATEEPVKKENAFGAAMRKAAADVKAAAQEQQAKQAAAQAEGREKSGNLTHTAVFGGTTVEVYDGGYVRVSTLMTKGTPFEKLRSVSYTQQVQDKSKGGRAMAGLATGGLNYLASKEKRFLFLTIATERKVHTFKTTGGMGRADDKAGLGLEAACKGVLDAVRAEAAYAAPVLVQQVAAPAPTAVDQLRQLADLHRGGILSDEEFAAAKAKALGL